MTLFLGEMEAENLGRPLERASLGQCLYVVRVHGDVGKSPVAETRVPSSRVLQESRVKSQGTVLSDAATLTMNPHADFCYITTPLQMPSRPGQDENVLAAAE